MQLLNQNISIDSFFSDLKKAENSLLMLDYDGTLSPFTEDRDNAVPYDGVKKRLETLIESSKSQIFIISGREISILKKLLNLKKYPELYGSHGAEYFSETDGYQLLANSEIKIILDEIKKWSVENAFNSLFEIKPLSCAFHWRGKNISEIEKIKSAVEKRWKDEISSYGMEMHYFDGGIEIKLRSVNKGNAVNRIFKKFDINNTSLAYLGDDITDEDAFEAIGENGLKVLVGEKKRETKADLSIIPPKELYQFLDSWIISTKKI